MPSPDDIALIGWSISPMVRNTDKTEAQLLLEVITGAVEDAGITRKEVDFTCAGSCDYVAGQAFSFVQNIDAIELTREYEVDLPQVGVVTSYTIITPVQYPGQTETEPFSRVHVWLDGTDVILGYQPLVDVPNADVRVGMRVAAVWASEAEKADLANRIC